MNKIKKFNKLVRDRIPDIIKSHGKKPVTRILTESEYFTALKQKLVEETAEFEKSESIEELADVMEVVLSLATHLGSSANELEEFRLKKQQERGSFKEKVFLIETELVDKCDF